MAMRHVAALALLLATSGCKSLNGQGPLSWTRTKERGVCARVDASAFFRNGGAAACARTRPGQEGREPFLYSEISSTESFRAAPGDWRVRVLRPDGTVLLDRPVELKERIFPCMTVVCPAIVHAKLEVAEGWRPGTYRIRYSYLPRPLDLDLSLTLE